MSENLVGLQSSELIPTQSRCLFPGTSGSASCHLAQYFRGVVQWHGVFAHEKIQRFFLNTSARICIFGTFDDRYTQGGAVGLDVGRGRCFAIHKSLDQMKQMSDVLIGILPI